MKLSNLFTLAFIFLSLSLNAQESAYQQAMQQALETMGKDPSTQGRQQMAARFEQIANAAGDEWLPGYYAALNYTLAGFAEEDGDRVDAFLDKGQDWLDRLMEDQPKESELITLQGFLYLARIKVSPMVRGMEYSPKASDAFEKAQKLNANNPRAYYLAALNVMNTPSFFGGGMENACPLFDDAQAAYERFEAPAPFWPKWGKEATEKFVKKCQSGK